MAPSAIPLWGPVRWGLSIPEPPNVRSRVLFRSDRGHYRRREAPDPQRLQRGRGFVHVKARQAFPEIGRQVRRREQTAVAEAVTRTFALGEASRLQSLFSEAGFADIE